MITHKPYKRLPSKKQSFMKEGGYIKQQRYSCSLIRFNDQVPAVQVFMYGARGGTRTRGTLIKSQVPYHQATRAN